jgi:[lysine-biosynthesis-protein LysW]---L-2-aminoadipate ligase
MLSRQRASAGIAVLASQLRADEKRILGALERRGIRPNVLDSRADWGFAEGPHPGWSAVLNREIGQARALYAASVLEASGVQVINTAAAIETCGDKWRTTLALRRAGLPVPRTALALTPQAALSALDAIGYPAVVKPLTGSWGRLVTAVPDRRTAEIVMEYVAALPSPQSHIVYVQELVPTQDRDLRVIVVGGVALGGVYRHGCGWRTNVALGAACEPCPLSPGLAHLAESAAAAVGTDIAGVDLVEDADGRPLVLEVNHRVEFAGFQQAHGGELDVAERIAGFVLERAGPCSG